MLLVGRQERHPAYKKLESWGTDMAISLTVSCFSKIQIGFIFLVPADPGSLGKRAVCVCVCACVRACVRACARARTRTHTRTYTYTYYLY